jgi:hypothetical protein
LLDLIEDDFVPPALFDETHWFIDSENLSKLPNQDKINSIVNFFSTPPPTNSDSVKTHSVIEDSVKTYSGIESSAFIKSVSEFVKSEKTSSRPQDQTLLRALSSLNLSEGVNANKINGARK